MSKLDTIKGWIAKFPGYDILGDFYVDYTDQMPSNGGIFPSGLVEVSRKRDIVGNTTVENQLNYAIYTVFPKAKADDIGATVNAEWVADFQEWVQEQSVTGQAPVFGDVAHTERITAQNGMMYETDEEGTAMYVIQLAVSYEKEFPCIQ